MSNLKHCYEPCLAFYLATLLPHRLFFFFSSEILVLDRKYQKWLSTSLWLIKAQQRLQQHAVGLSTAELLMAQELRMSPCVCVCVRIHQPSICNICSLTNTLVPDSVKVSTPEKLELHCQHSPCDDA